VPVGGTKATEWPYTITGGTRPSDWAQFNQVITGAQRVNGVIDWLRRPKAIRPRLVTVYFDTVDTIGHTYGPDDQRTTDAVAEVDTLIGDLMQGLDELGQPANLVIVADHGMAQTSSERVVLLTDYVAKDDYRLIEGGPYASLFAAEGKQAAVEKALLGKHPHFECWRKGEIPARFHYGSNPRVPPILCLAEIGWEITDRAPKEPGVGGAHGYDHEAPEMAALFIASGPAFKVAKLPAFDNVDVYPLLRHLLGLPVKAGVDGSDQVFVKALTAPM
jgi:predicted AlkP superfamily pyrophosphatase or phosphodiesterase